MEGWIKLHRKLLDWEWYSDSTTKDVFLHLLLTACFEPRRWKGEELEAGSVVTSLNSMADALGLTINQIRTALKHLERTGEIAKKTTNKNTVIILCNYGIYQGFADCQITNKTQTNNSQTTIKSQSNHNQITRPLYNKNERMKECKNNNKTDIQIRACACEGIDTEKLDKALEEIEGYEYD